MILNKLAWKRCEQLVDESVAHRVSVVRQEGGARLVDCGVFAAGGLEAGLAMAEICLAVGKVDTIPLRTGDAGGEDSVDDAEWGMSGSGRAGRNAR